MWFHHPCTCNSPAIILPTFIRPLLVDEDWCVRALLRSDTLCADTIHELCSAVIGEVDEALDSQLDLATLKGEPLKAIVH
jgi:hypothetical protein